MDIIAVIFVGIATIILTFVYAVCIALCYLILFPVNYFISMLNKIKSEAPEADDVQASRSAKIFRLTERPDRKVAQLSYFFGPAEADARAIGRAAIGRCGRSVSKGSRTAENAMKIDAIFLRTILGNGMQIGLVAGTVVGTMVTALVAFVHMATMAASTILAITVGMSLRAIDTAMRFIGGIVIRCPNPQCSRPVRPYPAYRCSGCGELHKDIRPGPYGIVWRICTCGTRLPTLLITGTANLMATCRLCGTELHPRTGKAAEIVISFFGGANTGKTQLIYSLVAALKNIDERLHVEPNRETAERLNRIAETLASSGRTSPTLMNVRQPYVLHLRLGLSERLIYLYDAAGEIHYKLATLKRSVYHNKGRTVVFVADPLAADNVWDRLSTEEQQELSPLRSQYDDSELAYEQTREHMRRLGREDKHMRIAFVVSKGDLLPAAIQANGTSEDTARKTMTDLEGLDLGNLVREASQSFKSVNFFQTSALVNDAGYPDESVIMLARWILRSEGIILAEPSAR